LDRRQTIPKKIRYFFEYLLFRFILFPIQLLPLSGICFLGRLLGTALYHTSPRRQETARINLDIAFGDTKTPKEKKAEKLAKKAAKK